VATSKRTENVNKVLNKDNQLTVFELNEQYKRLNEDYTNFKLEICAKDTEKTKIISELKEEDKCPFCDRQGDLGYSKDVNNNNNENSLI